MITFVVYGEPVGKARARTVQGKSGFIHSYTPAKSRKYEDLIRYEAQRHAGAGLLMGALMVKIWAFRSPTKVSQKKRVDMLEGTIRPISRPDTDNYAKSVLDALNGILFKDDSQVVALEVQKWFGDPPRIEIEITQLEASNGTV